MDILIVERIEPYPKPGTVVEVPPAEAAWLLDRGLGARAVVEPQAPRADEPPDDPG